MGEYFVIVNLTKKQFIRPNAFGCGAMSGLAFLLANGECSGDVIGSWAGDKIVVSGGYAKEGQYGIADTLYQAVKEPEEFEDVSNKVITVMCENESIAHALAEGMTYKDLKDVPLVLQEKVRVLQEEETKRRKKA